jgi:hypothetical protein
MKLKALSRAEVENFKQKCVRTCSTFELLLMHKKRGVVKTRRKIYTVEVKRRTTSHKCQKPHHPVPGDSPVMYNEAPKTNQRLNLAMYLESTGVLALGLSLSLVPTVLLVEHVVHDVGDPLEQVLKRDTLGEGSSGKSTSVVGITGRDSRRKSTGEESRWNGGAESGDLADEGSSGIGSGDSGNVGRGRCRNDHRAGLDYLLARDRRCNGSNNRATGLNRVDN